MAALAVDPTIRRQVMAGAREVLAADATAPVARPVIERTFDLPMDSEAAVDELVASALEGLVP